MSRPALLVAAGLAATAAATAVALWPLQGNGVSGSVVQPEYREFGFFVVGPVSSEPTAAELRSKGVVLPEDVVADRRDSALAVAAAAGLLAVAGTALQARTGSG